MARDGLPGCDADGSVRRPALFIRLSGNLFLQNVGHTELRRIFAAINYLYYNLLQMKKGTVKFFNESKGFGFIIEDDSQEEYFVHASGLIDEIREGDAVEFGLKEGRKGLNAVDVKTL